MVRVAICDNDTAERTRLRNAIERFVDGLGVCSAEIAVFDTAADLAAVANRLRSSYFDVLVCSLDTNSSDEIDMLKRLHDANPESAFATYSASKDKAIDAYAIVSEFFVLPCTANSFERAIGSKLLEVADRKKSLFAIKTSEGLCNIDLKCVTFVESSKKGPIIHLPGGKTIPARGTLQSLHERLNAANPQFVKAGGSFIVNLDNIRMTGESSVIFGDGEAIIIPIRARKPLKEAFTAFRLGREAG